MAAKLEAILIFYSSSRYMADIQANLHFLNPNQGVLHILFLRSILFLLFFLFLLQEDGFN